MINLKKPERLQPLVDLLKDFSIPEHIKTATKKVGLPELELVRSVSTLVGILLNPNWREWPMQFDVPTTSQIFGQLVADAGIEGVIYTSKFTNKDCLAVFPQNFDDLSNSFIELDDEAPKEIKTRRLDAKIWADMQKIR